MRSGTASALRVRRSGPDGLAGQVAVGPDEGLKHDSALHCDELVSLPKARLTRFVGRLSSSQIRNLDRALAAALDIDVESLQGAEVLSGSS